MVKNQGERWWNKVEQRHEPSGIGSLVRPEDIYISPSNLDRTRAAALGIPADPLSKFFEPLLAFTRALGVDVRL